MEIRRIDGGRPPDAVAVRRAVFVDEQGVPERLELDGRDDEATHFVAYDGGRPVGVARLRAHDRAGGSDGGSESEESRSGPVPEGTAPARGGVTEPTATAKVERVAVLAERRNEGIGRELMDAVERAAEASGYDRLLLHAQVPVVPFYKRLGYDAFGDTFAEADIPHRRMRKEL